MGHRLINDAGWLEEKLLYALKNVAGAMEDVNRLQELSAKLPLHGQEKEEYFFLLDEMLRSHLFTAMSHLALIASVFRQESSRQSPTDVYAIEKNAQVGLVDALSKYGLSDWLIPLGLNPALSSANVLSKLARVLELVKGTRSDGRTAIYDELQDIRSVIPAAGQILELIEPVTQGEKSWEAFQAEAELILRQAVKDYESSR